MPCSSPLQCGAFLALWNGRSPSRDDYDVWHSREHVPERLTVPGMVGAIRYDRGKGSLPPYFTLYLVEDLTVFDHPSYVELLRNPTSWSASMRPDFNRFLRLVCTLHTSRGAGLGGYAIACLVENTPPDEDMRAMMESLSSCPSVNATCFGVIDSDSRDVPFTMPVEDVGQPYGVLLIQGYLDDRFEAQVADVLDAHSQITTSRSTLYHMSLAMDAAAVPQIAPIAQPLETSTFQQS